MPEARSQTELPAAKRWTTGLRVQLIMSIAGIMLVAFVPLFIAIAWLTSAEVGQARDLTTTTIAETTGKLACAEPNDASLRRLIAASGGMVDGLRVLDAHGMPLADVGAGPRALRSNGRHGNPDADGGSTFDVICDGAIARVRLRPQAASSSDQVPRLVALYIALFALALLVFLYISMTRLIVRPLDRLVLASERVAAGARQLDVPRTGARELVELGRAVQTMTTRLLGEEEALRGKIDELTKTTARLTEARDQVTRSDRLASVGRLAAGLAHEVGNPLAALLGLEDLLLSGDLDVTEQQDFLARMKRETERIHGVMRDLLDYARSDSPPSVRQGDGEPPAEVLEVCSDIERLARPQKSFRRVTITLDIAPPSLSVSMPASKLTQVLLNLVMNAAQALGGEDRDGRIVLRARSSEDGQSVRISVEDDGPGVPASIRDRVFEPFVTTKTTGEGTGLGLAVCRGLVESAGGSLDFADAAPHGTIFTLSVPASLPV